MLAGSLRKVLHVDPRSGGYVHLRYAKPGGRPKSRHYHRSVRESFFWLEGDLPVWDYNDAVDDCGRLTTFRRGFHMDRPPRSIHGRKPEPESVTGSLFLIWSSTGGEFEADANESIRVPFDEGCDSPGDRYTAPTIVNSESMPWRPHPSVSGWRVKRLSTGNDQGACRYPVSLVHVPPGWSLPEEHLKIRTGNEFWLYLLSGDLPVRMGEPGDCLALRERDFLWWGEGVDLTLERVRPSEIGCVLLCVGHEMA